MVETSVQTLVGVRPIVIFMPTLTRTRDRLDVHLARFDLQPRVIGIVPVREREATHRPVGAELCHGVERHALGSMRADGRDAAENEAILTALRAADANRDVLAMALDLPHDTVVEVRRPYVLEELLTHLATISGARLTFAFQPWRTHDRTDRRRLQALVWRSNIDMLDDWIAPATSCPLQCRVTQSAAVSTQEMSSHIPWKMSPSPSENRRAGRPRCKEANDGWNRGISTVPRKPLNRSDCRDAGLGIVATKKADEARQGSAPSHPDATERECHPRSPTRIRMLQKASQSEHGATTIALQNGNNAVELLVRREQSLERRVHPGFHDDERALAFCPPLTRSRHRLCGSRVQLK
jgi:hypothetical protein